MERMWMMHAHLEMHEILHLAMAGEQHEHLDSCAFCRTEYDETVDLLTFEDSASSDASTSAKQWRTGHVYRLAAQDAEQNVVEPHVRRTWYLENGTAVLRVMEDPERGILYGHLIADPERYSTVLIRFSGLEHDFHPDQRGTFTIGPSDCEIERMDAFLIER